MLGVLVERAAVAVAQSQRCRAFPVGGEAADVGEFVVDPALGEVGEGAAGADGGELVGVADE
ncbi:hypothetical protein [Pseudonocardia endophytica]|uniref:hypothetical protein n=1 Tax=Pseudonocardia endophytica TaxID=401976 RepID=UPI0010494E7E|nr:hypothetical protein [Pseudonocardia endophytica]